MPKISTPAECPSVLTSKDSFTVLMISRNEFRAGRIFLHQILDMLARMFYDLSVER